MEVIPKKVRVYFALLNKGWVRREFAATQLPEMMSTPGVECLWENPEKSWGEPIYSNRNAIVKRFLATDCDFLIMQDVDIVPYHNPMEMALFDVDVVGSPAKVRQKGQQSNWVAFIKDPKGEREGHYPIDFSTLPLGDLVQVDIVGTGLICIRREVLEKIKAPFTIGHDEDGITNLGTDFAFCVRAAEAGFKIYTTPQRVCEHYKEMGLLDITSFDDSDNFCHDNAKYKMFWGDWAITQRDWRSMRALLEAKEIKRVAEFGAGLSSLLMSEMVEVFSLETDPMRVEEVMGKRNGNNLTVVGWNGVDAPSLAGFDLIFIDGPVSAVPPGRRFAYKAAVESGAKYILTHDSGRVMELALAREFLWKGYNLTWKSGHHQQHLALWEKREAAVPSVGE